MEGIEDLHLGSDVTMVPPVPATQTELLRVHDLGYLEELAAFCRSGGGELDQDTYATSQSWTVAITAAGAGLTAIEALRKRGEGVAFVPTRPPGHHALPDRAMGFCLVNNIAVSAAALVAVGERVLIVDWDVHHGNGTQAIFWDDPRVLYVSLHQAPLFPGTGRPAEIGGRAGLDRTVNIPLPAKATGDVVRHGFESVAVPVIEEFKPTWVLVSAGFDAHRSDPLADLALSSGDFADLAQLVSACAPRSGRLVLFLEGGYDLSALRMSVATTVGALLGCTYRPEASTSGGPGLELVERTRVERIESLRRSMIDARNQASDSWL
jgi:acetoin utilization deacetylase AcuC-like enzyme